VVKIVVTIERWINELIDLRDVQKKSPDPALMKTSKFPGKL
jgi:hypothetical protein